jgi:hypothetical protein
MNWFERLVKGLLVVVVLVAVAAAFGPAAADAAKDWVRRGRESAAAAAAARAEEQALAERRARLDAEAALAAENAAAEQAAKQREQEQKRVRERRELALRWTHSPADLVDAYDANEVAADRRFKGELVAVRGRIRNVGRDLLNTPYVSLTTGEKLSFRGVQCFFAEADADNLVHLRKGETVTILGTCDGLMGNVLLKDCAVVAE